MRRSNAALLALLVVVGVPTIHSTDEVEIPTVPAEGSIYQLPQSFVGTNLRAQSRDYCQAWNQEHYRTFDGKLYSFPSKCTYIFAKDCVYQSFSIYTTNGIGCNINTKCTTEIDIYVGSTHALHLTRSNDHVMVTDKKTESLVLAPAMVEGMIVEELSHYTIIDSKKLGFRLQWDGHDYLYLELDDALKNRTCGLCGRYNGNPADDFYTLDKKVVTSASTFAADYKKDSLIGEKCQETAMSDAACQTNGGEADLFCMKMLNTEFIPCHNIIDTKSYLDTCRKSYCSSGKVDACTSFQVYFEACLANHGPIIDWRAKLAPDCAFQCSNGMVYNRCGSACENTCSSAGNAICNNPRCVDGCHCIKGYVKEGNMCIRKTECPCQHGGQQYQSGDTYKRDCNTCTCEGGNWKCTAKVCDAVCSSTGDPHYRTFDGKKFDFHGHCKYYLVKGDKYAIAAQNEECGRGGAACTNSITVFAGNHIIELEKGNTVRVDGVTVAIPHTINSIGASIIRASSMFVQVKLANGAKVIWDGKTRAYVTLPYAQSKIVKGLCGNFNGITNDDFMTAQGAVETNPNIFGNEWKVDKDCPDVPENFTVPEACANYVDREPMANKHCGAITSDLFKQCENFVEAKTYFDNCKYDVCECQTSLRDCMCDSYAAYASECAKSGILIPWRSKVPMCEVQCPPGQQYLMCGSACNSTCSNIASDPGCEDTCVEGCACPPGLTLNDQNRCVPVEECPCHFDGREVAAGTAFSKLNEVCECSKGLLTCIPKTSLTPPPPGVVVPPIAPICTGGKEYTSCKKACAPSCQHPSGDPGCNLLHPVCKAGCDCPAGTVLEGDRCIPKATCPCHYHGKAYSEGQKIPQDCKTCTCRSQRWVCDDKVCPSTCKVYGESHYNTFDGKEYQFQGDCDYVLVQSTDANPSKFVISTSNVPCGSSGVTCTKSIDISIGDPFGTGNDFEQLHLVRGKPIKLNPNSKLKVNQVGLFVVIQADFGLTIHWDRGTRVYVKLQSQHTNKVTGLCGNFNGDQMDDFKAPNGGIEAKPTVFADSWKVNSHCPPSKSVPEPCLTTPHRKPWAQEKCSLIMSDQFAACHVAVAPKPYYDRCEYDACACDYGGDCECLCTALAAYAQECSNKGVHIKWRTQDVCPLQCADCDEYTPCMKSCPKKTCDNKGAYDIDYLTCEKDMCVEGCQTKPCPPGQVYVNSTRPYVCIEEALCPVKECHINGKFYPSMRVIKDPKICGVCESCWCEDGQLKKNPVLNCVTTTAGTTVDIFQLLLGGGPTTTPHPSPTRPTTVPTTTIQPTTTPLVVSTTPPGVPKPPKCVRDGWTDWMDSSTPTSISGGDFETHDNLRLHYEYCETSQISNVRCRLEGSQLLSNQVSQTVHCDVKDGFRCLESENGGQIGDPSPKCDNYVIQFFCECKPEKVVTTPLRSTRTVVTANGTTVTFSTRRPAKGTTKSPTRQPTPKTGTGVTPPTNVGPPMTTEHLPPSLPPTRRTTTISSTLIACDVWSDWMSSSTPNSQGEMESMASLRKKYVFCAHPSDIECRSRITEVSYDLNGQFGVSCSLNNGLVCENNMQPVHKDCEDYEVRVYCPCDPSKGTTISPSTGGNPPTGTNVSPPTGVTPPTGTNVSPPTGGNPPKGTNVSPPTGVNPPTGTNVSPPTGGNPPKGTNVSPPTGVIPPKPYCNEWSDYYNIGNPHTGSGDKESIKALIMQKNICNGPGEVVTGVECRLSGSGAPWTSGAETGVVCGVQHDGLRCLNSDQDIPGVPIPGVCSDYEISIMCECKTQTPPPVTDPSCIEWGPWVDTHQPQPPTIVNDVEPLSLIQASYASNNFPCPMPVKIKCRAIDDQSNTMSWISTGQNVQCDPTAGLTCTARHGETCLNYQVQLGCLQQIPFCLSRFTTPTTTPSPTTVAPLVCKGVDPSKCPTSCGNGLMCDGVKCVPPKECPCVLPTGILLPPNVDMRNEKCETCHCFMSKLKCTADACPPCPPGTTHSFDNSCGCQCKPCAISGHHMCGDGHCIPPTQVCDGIIHCDNDEANCVTPPPFEQPTTTPVVGPPTTTAGVCVYQNQFYVDTDGNSVPLASLGPYKSYKPQQTWMDGNCRSCTCLPTSEPGKYKESCVEAQCQQPGILQAFARRTDLTQCCAPLAKIRCQVVINGIPQIYEIGDTWPSVTDVCEEKKCVIDSVSGDAYVHNDVLKCDTTCPQSQQYVPSKDPSQCCGTCEPIVCTFNGTSYNDNEVIPSNKKCYQRTCQVANGSPQWLNDPIPCVAPKRYCVMGESPMDDDACCAKCISKCSDCSPKQIKNETLITIKYQHPTNGLCVAKAQGLNECSGYCSSSYTVGRAAGTGMSNCNCCKPAAYEPLLLVYNCERNVFTEMINNPSACHCDLCVNN